MLALIEMNLLPGGKRGAARRAKRGLKLSLPKFESTRADPLLLGVIGLAVVAFGQLGYSFVSQRQELDELKQALGAQRQDSVRYAENIVAADSLKAQQDTLQQKADIIRAIDSDRFVWAHILDNVSKALPDFTWLTSLQQTSGSGGDVEFRIDGMTGQTQALTRFMRDLEESPFIRDVRLVSQEQTQQGLKLVHNFVLTARYQTPDSSAIVTEPIILAGE